MLSPASAPDAPPTRRRARSRPPERRGDKGLLITTGTFSADARREATRDGAPIDLVDGQQLCALLKRYELGVTTVIRQEEDVHVTPNFFAGI